MLHRPVLFLCSIVVSLWSVTSTVPGCSPLEPYETYERWQDGRCYLPASESLRVTDSFDCPRQKNLVSWKLLETPGFLEVGFPFIRRGRGFDSYHVSLYVDGNSPCGGPRPFWELHSAKVYKILKCGPSMAENCSPACGETAKIWFRYVFSGCYRLVVEAYNVLTERRGPQSKSCPELLTTTYNMAPISSIQPKITLGPIPQLQMMDLTYTHLGVDMDGTRRLFELYKWDGPENGDAAQCTIHQRTWLLHLLPNQSIKCETDKSELTPKCSRNQNTVTCTVYDIGVGYYCLSVEIDNDERCETETIWTSGNNKVCKWQLGFNITQEQYNGTTITVTPPEAKSLMEVYAIYVVVITTLLILFIIILLTYIWYKRREGKPRCSQEHYVNHLAQLPQNPNEKTKILLLYARDCSPFMKLMASFRLVLQHVANCEVLDCFDPMLAEEVSSGPAEWVWRQVMSPAVKVVVVATECAAVRQKAQVNGTMTAYKSPTCFDDLFLYGLKSITYNVHDGYNKCYLVRFDKFTDDNNLLSYLTPQRRFVLPLHLGDLISYLNQVELFAPDNKLESQWEVQQLMGSLTNLVNYKMQNEDYLRELIMVL